jgi:hypothetical protein
VGSGNTSTTFYDLANGAYNPNVTVSPATGFVFAGFTGGPDRALVGTPDPGSAAGGHLFEYSKNPFGTPTFSQWTRTHDITSSSGTNGFGTAVAFSGNYALVSDPSAFGSSSTVHRFLLDTNGGSGTVLDDSWSEIGSFGQASMTYGTSIGMYLNIAAIGEPSTNSIYVWPVDNVTNTFLTSDPTTHVTVTATKIGDSGTVGLQAVSNCTNFAAGTIINTTTGICANVTVSAELFGRSTICFPRAADSRQLVYRCHPRAACNQGEIPSVDANGQLICCTSLAEVAGPSDQYCVQTDTFSSFGYAVGNDRDSDSVPDLIDNCPSISNLFQQDRDADGVGDPCDNCPDVPNPDQKDSNHNGIGDACDVAQAVPVPRGAAIALGLLLGIVGCLGAGFPLARRSWRRDNAPA